MYNVYNVCLWVLQLFLHWAVGTQFLMAFDQKHLLAGTQARY